MSDLKKKLIKLMEEADMNYQSPFDPNSGNGITKFAPTPASKVLKSYNVSGDFLRKAIGYGGGVAPQAIDQIMGGIDGQQCDGPLCGDHFDSVLGSFGVGSGPADVPPMAGAVAVAPGVPEMGDGGAMGGAAPVDTPVDSGMIDPAVSDIGAGQAPGPDVNAAPGEGIPQDDDDAAINAELGEPVAPPEGDPAASPEGVEPADGVEDEAGEGEEEPVTPMSEGKGPQHGAGDSSAKAKHKKLKKGEDGKVTDEEGNEYEKGEDEAYYKPKKK